MAMELVQPTVFDRFDTNLEIVVVEEVVVAIAQIIIISLNRLRMVVATRIAVAASTCVERI